MARYKCIRRCHWKTRLWNEGEVLDLEIVPPHHFILVDRNTSTNTVLHREMEDPLRPKVKKEISSYSEMNEQAESFQGGFASSLKGNKPMTSMKQMRNK